MRTRLRTLAAATAAVAVVGLSGCGADPSVVAYVGNQTVTQQQLDEGVAGVNQALTEGNQIPVSDVVNVLIHGRLADQIAATKSITVTDSERDQALAARNLTPLLQVPAAKTVVYDSATEQLVIGKLGQQEYLSELGKITVTLNPRFGVLNPQTKTVIEDSTGSLAGPLATPQAP